MNKLTISYYDTCLPNYFSGTSVPYIQIPAYKMTLEALKQALKQEAGQCIVNLNDEDISDELYAAILSAIDDIALLADVDTVFDFFDFDDVDEAAGEFIHCDTVYAYFLIEGIDQANS